MAAGDNAAQLASMFAELKASESVADYEKALKTANKILNLSPGNSKAEHCRMVCLVQLGKFEDALKFFGMISVELRNELFVEKAYCEYRLNRITDALKTLGNSKTIAAQELRVQALYRLEDYSICYESYVELIKNSNDDYEDERMVNLSAALTGLTMDEKDNPMADEFLCESENIYEIIYNKACILISSERYDDALKKLNKAEEMCKQFLENDGASEEEIESELAIIRAQIAFCNQKLSKPELAMKLYNQVLRQKADDAALSAVASNNIVVLHGDQNIFDSKKKMKSALSEAADAKLSTTQKRNIHFNNVMFLINTNQNDLAMKELQDFKAKYPEHSSELITVQVYVYLKERNTDKAIETLVQFANKKQFDDADLPMVMLLVQLYLDQGNAQGAVKVLEKIGNLRFYPAIMSILYTLYQKEQNHKAIEDLFVKTIQHHEEQKSAKAVLLDLYREASDYLLNQNKPQLAVKYLEKIAQIGGRNPKITSQLINAYSLFDKSKAQKMQTELPSIEEILQSVDIEYLEEKNWSLGVKYVKKTKDTPKPGSAGGADKVDKKKKKKRKVKLPKNYDPNVKPDPERWLPRSERSTYKKKKDKKGVGKGTQGSTGEMPEIKQTVVAPSPQGPRAQRPTQKKKKGKGRK